MRSTDFGFESFQQLVSHYSYINRMASVPVTFFSGKYNHFDFVDDLPFSKYRKTVFTQNNILCDASKKF